MMYLILSLKWSQETAVWWGSDDAGYTVDINEAGRYSEERVNGNLPYYSNGISTLAVLEEDAIKASVVTRTAHLASFWSGGRREVGLGVVQDG